MVIEIQLPCMHGLYSIKFLNILLGPYFSRLKVPTISRPWWIGSYPYQHLKPTQVHMDPCVDWILIYKYILKIIFLNIGYLDAKTKF
jgi:hypothetical protein